MAKEYDFRLATKPGLEQMGPVTKKLYVSRSEGRWGWFSPTYIGSMDDSLQMFLCGGLYVGAGSYTETKDNSSTISTVLATLTTPDQASDQLAAVRFGTQATPTANDDVTVTSAGKLVVENKVWVMNWEVAVSDVSASGMGFNIGLVTAGSTEIGTADPADGIWFSKPVGSAAISANVRANSGTKRSITSFFQSGTPSALTSVAATTIKMGIKVRWGSTLANAVGEWWIGEEMTPMDSLQMTELLAMLNTTPAVLSAHIGFRVASTTQRYGYITHAVCEAGR